MVWRAVASILMTSLFSDSIVFSVHSRKQRFQKASFSNHSTLKSFFSNGSVFSDRFRRCSVDDSRIRSKTAPFPFENGLVWTGPYEPVKSKLQHPPRATPRAFEFLKNFCSNPLTGPKSWSNAPTPGLITRLLF